jgi:hypothetical protein
MLVAILGDCHFGMRSDSISFHNHYKNFYDNVFFPHLRDNNIKHVIQLGDLFDRRKFINFNTLFLSRNYFFDKFNETLKLYTFPGNHDIFYRNTLSVNSIELTLQEYVKKGFINVYTKPSTIDLGDGTNLDLIPWVCKENEQEIKEFIKNTHSQICFGHFEIQGFEMERGHVCIDGMAREELSNYEIVVSGHFHHRSTDGHIFYVGSPGEITWADYNDSRGFHIFNTVTRELEFIENPNQIHHKIIYDDSQETLESVKNKDYSNYNNTILKVIVQCKENPFIFDTFMEELYSAQPLDISIVEDFSDTNISDEDVIDQSDDTMVLVQKYIDNIETTLDKEKLKNIMRDIHIESQNLESLKEIQ